MRSDPLAAKISRYRRALRDARRSGRDPDDVFGEREIAREQEIRRSLDRSHTFDPQRERVLDALEGGVSRREFLKRSAMVGAAMAGAGYLPFTTTLSRGTRAAAAPRIVIVGGGLAGMSAAYRLYADKGWTPTVYEAQERVGGRTRTIRGLNGGQYAEAGGGGINTHDAEIQALAQEVGLWPLIDTWKNYPGGSEFYHFNGKRLTWTDLKPGVAANLDRCWNAWTKIGKRIPTRADHNAAAATYDAMTVQTFLDSCPYPTSTAAGEYMAVAFGAEYGSSADRASALHQILEEGNFWESSYDERWAIPGGNDTLCSTLAGLLPSGSVQLGNALIALVRNGDGTVSLTFDTGGGTTQVVADRVVLAIPPTTLRQVDLTAAGFPRPKLRAIRKEQLGNGAKLNLQFSDKPWASDGDAGDTVSDLGLGETWQANFFSENPAVLIVLNNVDYGAAPAHGVAPAGVVTQTLAAVDTLWPGASASFITGQGYLDNWTADPWAKGTYSYYPPRGFTTFGGVQAAPVGNVFFAGEHTADYPERGYMCGAVDTGERAAQQVVASVT